MPSPLGHSLLGLVSADIVARESGLTPSLALWVGALALSNAPDLDWLAVVYGCPTRRVHRNASHSLLALTIGMAGLAGAWRAWRDGPDARLYLAWTAALLSHPLLDVVTTSSASAARGFGIPLLWPLTKRRWALPYTALHTSELAAYRSTASLGRALWREVYLVGGIALVLTLIDYLIRSQSRLEI